MKEINNGVPHTSTYAVDWFSEHIPSWERHVKGRFGEGVQALVIGPYEGRCLEWMFENVLRGAKSKATVLDAFEYAPCVSYKGVPLLNPDVRKTFDRNMRPYRSRIVVKPPASLRTLKVEFHIVYIDTRSSRHALETAVLAFPLLRPGGVMVLTNYTHSKEHDARCPRRGIDAFTDAYASEIKVLRSGFHFFLQRRVAPLKSQPCHSEYFDEPAQPRPLCSR
jgi:hypothetical protein